MEMARCELWSEVAAGALLIALLMMPRISLRFAVLGELIIWISIMVR